MFVWIPVHLDSPLSYQAIFNNKQQDTQLHETCRSLQFEKGPSRVEANIGRIRVRQGSDGPEFYNSETGEKFLPRGNNYIRLAFLNDPWGGQNFGHSLFDPVLYDPTCATTSLTAMRSRGYNTVRVFISEINSGSPKGTGLNKQYMLNVADFLKISHRIGMRVIIVFWRLPRQGGYQPTIELPQELEGVNAYFLHPPIIEAKKRYVRDFIHQLKELGAPLETVLAWDLENEAHFMENQRPLSLSSGHVRVANGKVYDMADQTDRTRIIEEGLVYWAKDVAQAVKEVEPNALVTVSFFSPEAVRGDDPRTVITRGVIKNPEMGGADLDLIDIHLYPGSIPIRAELRSFEISQSRKPIILGEMGIWMDRGSRAADATFAQSQLRALQAQSCAENFRVTGWILYSWDTVETDDQRRDLYTAYDNDWHMARRLSPQALPDPCVFHSAELLNSME
jgi:Cellulase (glycosyl hydrolase family 5)